jgi:uncharacterized protein
MNPLSIAGFVALGVGVGTVGTLIGAGGGFLLLPVLAFLDPTESPAVLTAISLAVVFANALSGSAAYARLRRIDFRAGIVFAIAALPGAVLGAMASHHLNRRTFDPLLGSMLIVGAAIILLRSGRHEPPPATSGTRTLIERDGTTHIYSPRMVTGALLSVGVGFISSLLGIGGGILHVPAMVYLLGFPAHVATATSHFVLVIVALAGVIVHWKEGTLQPGLGRIIPLAAGVLVGAQIGAWLSTRVHGRWILRGLAIALATVGVRLLLSH